METVGTLAIMAQIAFNIVCVICCLIQILTLDSTVTNMCQFLSKDASR
jgi:hypothetical protein